MEAIKYPSIGLVRIANISDWLYRKTIKEIKTKNLRGKIPDLGR
jgi:hypothetical protein